MTRAAARIEGGQAPPLGPAADRLAAIAARLPWSPSRAATRVDLRRWMPPILDQIHHPTCTAAVVTGVAGYHARRADGLQVDASLLFNYRMSRTLDGNPNRRGSLLRLAFAAWREYGLVDEWLWPFAAERVDLDPPPTCMRAALARRDVECWRLDERPLDGAAYLALLRRCLRAGLPVSVEFPLHPSLVKSFPTGIVPVPRAGEPSVGKHVVLVVGYDDEVELGGGVRGGLLAHNSWGRGWGRDGYGWLAYDFARAGLLRDSWLAVPTAAGQPPP